MVDTYTPHYNLTKPDVNASRDTWGNKWNANVDVIDTALKNLSDDKIKRLYATEIGFTGGVKTTPSVKHDDGTVVQLATKAQLDAVASLIPVGIIAMWSGSVANIPAGWKLCDGLGGAPDLRNRFVVGAGQTYAVGAVGGALEHNHGGTTLAHTLTVAQMPVHAHSVSDPGHTHSVSGYTSTNGSHSHSASLYEGSGSEQAVFRRGLSNYYGLGYVNAAGDHNHSFSGTAAGAYTGISIYNNGGGGAHSHGVTAANHLPPYYALAFIMRV